MNQEQQAVVAIRNLLRAFRGLAEIEDSLVDLGSLKQAINETQSRLTNLQQEEAQAKAIVEAEQGKLEAARQLAANIGTTAKADAEKLVADGERVAKELIAKAERACRVAEEAAQKRLSELEKKAVAAADRAKACVAEATAAQERFTIIQQKINEVVNSTRR